MEPNPYAPPNAQLADIVADERSPALWNPNAAASWSLVFSPVFGAYLHMKNWQALGQPDRATAARRWVVTSLAALIGISLLSALLPSNKTLDGVSRMLGFVLLLAWYYSSGKAQADFVKSHFGKEYPKKGWAKPLLSALAVLLGFSLIAAAAAFVAGYLMHHT